MIGAFIYLDITPKGRNEKEIMDWVRRHDEYSPRPPLAVRARVAPDAARDGRFGKS